MRNRDMVRAVCQQGYLGEDRYSRMEKRLAHAVLQQIARYRRERADSGLIYRAIMRELRQHYEGGLCATIRESLGFETGVATVQRLVLAALAVTAGEDRPR
jgi:hypothetical protein